MLQQYSANIVCDGSGAAIVQVGSSIRGYVRAVKYVKGTLHNDTDIALVGNTTGIAILTKANCGAADLWFFPQIAASKAADGSASTLTEVCPFVYMESIKCTVADGGAAGAGTIYVYVDEEK
jgi:hypothetical protein